jgi:hypothetical protein
MPSILSVNDIVAGMTQRSQLLQVSKSSLGNSVAGQLHSMWRSIGQPAQAAIPTTVAVCANGLTGSSRYDEVGATQEMHVVRAFLVSSNSGTDVQLFDRLSHRGGLVGNVTTGQTAGVTADSTANNFAARKGDADFSSVMWFLEWYTDTGATAANATCAVTYDDNSTGNIVVAVPATTRASRILPILSAVAGRWIKSVDTVTLSVSTGTAGNFGVTAGRRLAAVALGLANSGETVDWAMLGLPRIHAEACLWWVTIPSTTSTGTLTGGAQLISSPP